MKKILSSLAAVLSLSSVIAQPTNLFFEENFDQPTVIWYYSDQDTPEIRKKIENGSLHITQHNTYVYYTHNAAKLDPKKDFLIKTDVTVKSSGTAGGVHILLFGEDDKNYYFGMNANTRTYWVGSEQKGTWATIQGDSENNPIVANEGIKGLNEVNTLSLERKGDRLIYSINGKEMMNRPMSDFDKISRKVDYHGFATSSEGELFIDNYLLYQTSEINLLVTEKKGLKLEKLGTEINSEYSDRMPIISPDGQTLYYIRSSAELNCSKSERTDIWFSQRNAANEWSVAQCMGTPVNNNDHNAVLSIQPDNNTLILMHQYNAEGNYKSAGASVTRRTETGWSLPEDIVVKNFYNDASTNEFCFSNDYKVFIMTVQRKDSYGEKDLYVSFRNEDGTYSEPVNMGAVINSTDGEISPFLAADGKTLYFGSDGHPGYGRSDIFLSKRLDDTWTNWSKPQNLGSEINSPMWEAYFSLPASGEYAYIVANQGVSDDIFRIKLSPEFKPEPVVIVSGKVYNSKTKLPMGASILFSDIKTNKDPGLANSDPSTGSYKIALPAGKVYQFLGKKEGFYPGAENLDLTKLTEYAEMTRDLYLTPIEVGSTIRLNNLFFDFGKADLKAESMTELDRVVDFLNENATTVIEIGGHTDNVGDDASNLALSNRRVESVLSYLKSKGVKVEQLSGKGYGEAKPVAVNTTDAGRAMNRRVEFTIKKL